MAAGRNVTKTDLDNQLAGLALQGYDWLGRVERLKAWLDTKTEGDLVALGYSAGDVTLMKAAYTDLNNLSQTAKGQRTQTPASDFFFNAKQLWGTGI